MTTHTICDACETVSHCHAKGCIPFSTEAPIFRDSPRSGSRCESGNVLVTHETYLQSAPVCPHCGHAHRDAWEWNFGPDLEGTREVDCDSCGGAFSCEREVTVYYSTAAIAAAGDAA